MGPEGTEERRGSVLHVLSVGGASSEFWVKPRALEVDLGWTGKCVHGGEVVGLGKVIQVTLKRENVGNPYTRELVLDTSSSQKG